MGPIQPHSSLKAEIPWLWTEGDVSMEEGSEKQEVALLLVLKMKEGGHELGDECGKLLEAGKARK